MAPPSTGPSATVRGFSGVRRMLRSGEVLSGGFVALGIFISIAVIFSVRQRSDDRMLSESLRVELQMAEVLSNLQDAEIGQRGYMLTGDPAFLAPYNASAVLIDKRLATLGQSVNDNPAQSGAYVGLEALVTEKREELARTIQLQQAGQIAEALNIVRQGSGKHLMDKIRTRINEMDTIQDRKVAARESLVRRIGIVVGASTVISIVLMSLLAFAALQEVRRRARLARFLPAEIAPRLAEDDRSLREGRHGPAAVVFVDIRDSTRLAETLPPWEVSGLLSSFRNLVSTAAKHHRGMVDKFIGDGALVVFGAVEEDEEAAANALAFGHDLVGRLAATNRGTPYDVGIGIHYGDIFCGVVGEDDRLEFTVLGDTVNVASRLEQETKRFGVAMLVSDAVLLKAGENLARWNEVARETLRGRRAATAFYATRAEPTRATS